jgi:hypothetical protein
MATTYNGVGATNLAASIAVFAEEGQYKAKQLVHYDIFTLTADLAAGDVINMGGVLPQGAFILGVEIETEALGGSCAITYGYPASSQLNPNTNSATEAASAAGFMDSMTVSSAGARDLSARVVANVAAKWKRFQAAVQPQIACTVASSGGTGKRIFAKITYAVD